MKLAVITDEISQDFEHALDVMSEYGVRGAELRGLWGTNIADLEADQLGRAKHALKTRGIQIVALATPIYKCELNSDDGEAQGAMHLAVQRTRGDQIALLRKCARIAREFECDQLRIFAFWNKGAFTSDVRDQIVQSMEPLVQAAEEESMRLILENEHACYVRTGAEVADIVSRVNSGHLGICWDPGNAFVAGEHPFPGGYEHVRDNLSHVHIKDVRRDDDGQCVWTVVGEGDIDYPGQFSALKNDGYQGWVSLETHYIPKDGTAEEGSRACLQALRNYIKD